MEQNFRFGSFDVYSMVAAVAAMG